MRRILIFLGLALVCAAFRGRAATDDFFAHGVELNRAGQFPEAAAAFQNAIHQRPSSGALVNLGIAEWQIGHAGAAMLAWERAQWIDPFDSRAGSNLRFARTTVQVNELELRWHEKISSWLAADAWLWIAFASLWLATGALVLPRFFRWKKSGFQQTLSALGWMIFVLAVTANLGVASRTNLGLVVKNNSAVQLTPTRAGEVISTLAAGEPARVIKTRGDFYFIRATMTAGWVARKDFSLVIPE